MMTNYLSSQFRYQNNKLIFTVAYNYHDVLSIFQPQMMSYCRHLRHTPQPTQNVKQISTKKNSKGLNVILYCRRVICSRISGRQLLLFHRLTDHHTFCFYEHENNVCESVCAPHE